MTLKKTIITGTGSYLPERIVTNFDFEQKDIGTTDAWITERTGIKQRHFIDENQNTSDMAYHAAQKAIDDAGLKPHDIDLIICATITPDFVFPSVATIVQKKLGITNNCPAFDVSAACAGFVYALSVADSFIQCGNAKNILIIGADAMSRIVDQDDRTTCVLFGDGAGAFILSGISSQENHKQQGILATMLEANGHQLDILCSTGGAGNHLAKFGYLTMKGQDVFKVAVKNLSEIMTSTLEKAGLKPHDIDYIVPHQANQRIMDATAVKVGIDTNKVISYIAYHGNTSAASIPLAFDRAVKDAVIQRGHVVLVEAIGGGMTWGGAVFRY